MYIHDVYTEVVMGKEYSAKSFKSGNSVAIRMPAALRVEPDREWIAVREDDRIILAPKAQPKRKFNIAKVAGSAKGLNYVYPGTREFAPRPSQLAAQNKRG
jgi:antitoxin VapB